MAVDVAMLRSLSLFEDLNESQLEKVAKLCLEKSFSGGEAIFKEGEPGKTIFVLSHGEVEVLFTACGDALAYMGWIGAGDILGIRALVPPYRYSSTARGVTESTLLAVDTTELGELFQQDSGLASSLLVGLIGAALNRIDGLRSRM
jgi:CRP-like cAMP-binding protein